VKAVHNKIEKRDISLAHWLLQAKELESGDMENAIKEYKLIAMAYPKNEKAFDRLMILFRKLKKVKDELYWINKGIQNFREHDKTKKHTANSRIAKLSKIISRSTGLTDKKGNPLHAPAPVEKWMKRKELLTKRLIS
jgi:hypothetical protein